MQLTGNMDWIAFHKEFYFHEIERKFSLMRLMSLPVGVATLLASALLFLAGQLESLVTMFDIGLMILLCSSAILLFVSVYLMQRAYFGHAYHYVPTTQQIATFKRELENYYRQRTHEKHAVELADVETVEYLIGAFSTTTHHNSQVNDLRMRFIFWANVSLSGALFLLILSSLASVFDNLLPAVA
ncbi:MAG: hypothetical protein AB8B63_02410 [Granulosicoccus sp.]